MASATPLKPEDTTRLLDDACLERAAARVGLEALNSRLRRWPCRLEDDYEICQEQVLGHGINGDVVLGRRRSSGSRVAVKKLKGPPLACHGQEHLSQRALQGRRVEAEVSLTVDHPHVVRFDDVYELDDGGVALVMECLEGGELFDRLLQRQRFPEDEARDAARQMLLAISYLHSHGIVHRDIKLENFLLEDQAGNHLKLIDFGLSRLVEDGSRMYDDCGTLAYVAPEVLEKRGYTSQCDLWSLGVVVFILLAGYMPFSGPPAVQASAIRSAAYSWRADRWLGMSASAIDFIQKLLVAAPEQRLNCGQALLHAWLQEPAAPSANSPSLLLCQAIRGEAVAASWRRAWFLKWAESSCGTVDWQPLRHLLEETLAVPIPLLEELGAKLCVRRRDKEELSFSAFQRLVDKLMAWYSSLRGQSQPDACCVFTKFDANLANSSIYKRVLKGCAAATTLAPAVWRSKRWVCDTKAIKLSLLPSPARRIRSKTKAVAAALRRRWPATLGALTA
eukprot:TRINITY_DN100387_c0_g1_i1.p1 TRINITY_DN100387_c0_g1~~TRINITY_DN100387_c0_g1_i1.p1  ORF type:complete len:506 (-),score=93.35 TRINITY_DN100387_c0_g1_i1:167-1684(-)